LQIFKFLAFIPTLKILATLVRLCDQCVSETCLVGIFCRQRIPDEPCSTGLSRLDLLGYNLHI